MLTPNRDARWVNSERGTVTSVDGDAVRPGGDGSVDGAGPGWCCGDSSGGRVPVDRGVGVSGSEAFEGSAFDGVGLADVLGEDVHGVGVTGDDGFEAAAGAELAVVADDHGLRPSVLDGLEESEHRAVVGHAGLLDEQDGAGVEGEPASVEAVHEGGDGVARSGTTHPTNEPTHKR